MKHGAVISVVNLHGDGFGNATMPSRIRQFRRRSTSSRTKALWPIAASIIAAAIAVSGWLIYKSLSQRVAPNVTKAKSIASFRCSLSCCPTCKMSTMKRSRVTIAR